MALYTPITAGAVDGLLYATKVKAVLFGCPRTEKSLRPELNVPGPSAPRVAFVQLFCGGESGPTSITNMRDAQPSPWLRTQPQLQRVLPSSLRRRIRWSTRRKLCTKPQSNRVDTPVARSSTARCGLLCNTRRV